jgi:sodium/proline symporter
VVDILWLAFLSSTGVYEIVPGFLFGLLTAVAASLMSKEPGQEVVNLFDKVASKEEI